MTPTPSLWLQNLTLLIGPGLPQRRGEALLGSDGSLLALDGDAERLASAAGLTPLNGQGWLLAPTLVDPHSVLESPLLGRAETLTSLAAAAAAGGYGQVALLPWGDPPRQHPDQLQLRWPAPMQLHQWGSVVDADPAVDQAWRLSAHSELLNAGAIGLAGGGELPPVALLERGLQLGECGSRPLLLAPRQRQLSGGGLVRERIEALRAGWPVDPPCSETLPLATLISLQQSHPTRRLVAMNVSTQEATAALRAAPQPPLATVHWWQLLQDCNSLNPAGTGWRLEPPLGGPSDRAALIEALADGVITAAAVHHQALDSEEDLLPIDQRRAGLAGHGAVLPLLHQALVQQGGWSNGQLWQALCWGPCSLLDLAPEQLQPGSHRWLLFDPQAMWHWPGVGPGSQAANQPLPAGSPIKGRIRASGLLPPSRWQLD